MSPRAIRTPSNVPRRGDQSLGRSGRALDGAPDGTAERDWADGRNELDEDHDGQRRARAGRRPERTIGLHSSVSHLLPVVPRPKRRLCSVWVGQTGHDGDPGGLRLVRASRPLVHTSRPVLTRRPPFFRRPSTKRCCLTVGVGHTE